MRVTVNTGSREVTYQLDGGFTNREHMAIKRISGLRPAEYEEAFDSLDQGLFVALAVVAARRAGVDAVEDDYLDLPGGSIVVSGDEEPETDPPPVPAGQGTAGGRKKKAS